MAPLQHHFELLGWEEVTDRHPVLDHRRALRRRRARALLRRVGGGRRMSGAPTASRRSPHRDADWAALRVVVAGLGVSGLRGRRHPARSWAPTSSSSTPPSPPTARQWPRRPRCSRSSARRCGSATRRPRDAARRAVDLVVTSPGWRPRPAAAGRGRRGAASPSGARSSWPGGCATAGERRALARRDRHQRQDHDGADARRDAARRGAARVRRRQRRPADRSRS